MGGGAIYDAVRRRTTEALGFPVNLHLCVPKNPSSTGRHSAWCFVAALIARHEDDVEVLIKLEIVSPNFTRGIVDLKNARGLYVVIATLTSNLRKRGLDLCNLRVGGLVRLIG